MPAEPWAAYPPEMNAARILGPGTATLIIAAAGWAVQATEAAAAQAAFAAQNGIQVTNIEGLTSEAVAATMPPFVTWLADMQAEAARSAVEYGQFAQAHMQAVATMVPLPVIMANRVQSAAGHAATAAGAVNPVGVAADAQYEAFRVQNAAVMTGYDAAATVSSTPRVYSTSPPLVAGGAGADVVTGTDAVNAVVQSVGGNPGAVASQVQSITEGAQATLANPQTMAGLQTAAGTAGPYAAMPVGANPMVMQQTAQAMSPAASVAGQLARPQGPGGLTASGLGSGSSAMTPLRSMTGGGLPLSAARSSVPSLASLAGLLGSGSPGAGAGVGAGMGSSPMGRGFSGVPASMSTSAGSTPGTANGPMGGVPHGAGSGNRDKAKGLTVDAKDVAVVDTVAEAEANAARLAMYR